MFYSESSRIFYMNFEPKIIFLKMTSIGVILCGKSIAHISEAWKRFPDPGKGVGILKRKWTKIRVFDRKLLSRGFSRRRIDCAHFRGMKKFPWHWFKRFLSWECLESIPLVGYFPLFRGWFRFGRTRIWRNFLILNTGMYPHSLKSSWWKSLKSVSGKFFHV
jgi:hypothetical protein